MKRTSCGMWNRHWYRVKSLRFEPFEWIRYAIANAMAMAKWKRAKTKHGIDREIEMTMEKTYKSVALQTKTDKRNYSSSIDRMLSSIQYTKTFYMLPSSSSSSSLSSSFSHACVLFVVDLRHQLSSSPACNDRNVKNDEFH